MKNFGKVILASSSPRRFNLLKNFNFNEVQIAKPLVNEKNFIIHGSLKQSVKKIALEKALSIKQNKSLTDYSFIISGDTVVVRAGKILHKPITKEQVRSYLSELSGKKHSVYGGICVVTKKKIFKRAIITDVYFNNIYNNDLCEEFLEDGIGKAGGYAIQGYASKFIRKIRGCYTNVVGLSIPEVYKILKIL